MLRDKISSSQAKKTTQYKLENEAKKLWIQSQVTQKLKTLEHVPKWGGFLIGDR